MKKISFAALLLKPWWRIFQFCTSAVMLTTVLWCCGALYIAFDISAWLAGGVSGIILLIWLILVFTVRKSSKWFFAAFAALLLFQIPVIAIFCSITPEKRFKDVTWQKPWQRVVEITRNTDGDFIISNIRNFHYRSADDYDQHYTSATVSPEEISSVDIAFSHWDGLNAIAHSMIALNFNDGTTIVFSLETRLPVGVEQNALNGFYRRYELALIAGTPEDLYGLRTHHRGEALYVYQLNLSYEEKYAITKAVLEEAQRRQNHPEFYNSLFRNCTTGMLMYLPEAPGGVRDDIRVLVNGLADELLFEKNLLSCRNKESFESLKARSLVPGKCSGENAPPERYRGMSSSRYFTRLSGNKKRGGMIRLFNRIFNAP